MASGWDNYKKYQDEQKKKKEESKNQSSAAWENYKAYRTYEDSPEVKLQRSSDYVNNFRQRLSSAYDEYQKTFGNQQYNTQDTFNSFLKKYQNQFSDDSYLKYTRALRELQQAGAISNSDHTDLLKSTPYMPNINDSVKNMADYMSRFRGEDDNKRIEEINEELKRYYNISRVSKNYLSNEELEYYQGLEKELSDLKSKPIYEKTGKYALQYSGINDKDLNNRLTQIRDSYKTATDENRQAIQDEYNWLMNNAQGKTGETVRKAWHEDTQARIDDINKELQRFYSTQNKALLTKEEIQHFKDLERERDSLTAAVNNYKRGNTYVVNDEGQQQRVFLYGQDKYNVNREDPLFDTYAKRRSFDTSIVDEQEIRNRLNPENWHTEFDGKTYDQYGNEVTEAYINEWRSKTNAQDKLGVYLASSDEDKTQALSDNTTAYNRILNEGRSKFWHYLKDDEIDMYYYLLNKNGQQAALEFLDDMETELSRRDTEMMTEELREPASVADLERIEELNEKIKALKEKDDNSYAAKQELKALMQEKNQIKGKNFLAQAWDNVESVAGNIYGGILGTVDDMVHHLRGEDINPYSIWHRASNYSQAVRATTAEDFDKLWTDKQGNPIKILGIGLSDAYQSVMSLADMYAGNVLMGGGYGTSMGASAMSSTARDMFEQGASGQDIFWGSLLAGVAEDLFEEYSLEKFLSIKDTRTRREWLMNILKQSFTEGSEEFFTEIANNVTDMFVRGTQSNAMQRYYEYRTQGDSEGTATWKALRDIGIDSWKAFVGGAISGGLGGMGRSGSQYMQYNDQMNRRATNAINQGNVQGIYDTAQGKNIDYSLAEQAYNRYVEEQSNKNENKAVKETANVLKQIDETRRNEQISDITTSLIEKGVSERQAKKMAPVISDVLERGYVTEEDDKVFRNNRDIALQVAQEARNGFAANRNFEYEVRLEGDKETAEYIKNERIAAAAPKLSFDGTVDGQSSSFTYDHIDGDTLYVKTADGQVVNADDVQTTNRNAIQVMQDSVLFGDDGARAYLNGYEGGSASEYRQTFTNIYNQAKAGANVETLVSEMVAQGVSEKVARLAAYEGQNAYEAIQSNDVEQIRKYIDRTEAKKIEENVKQAAKGQETEIEKENKEAEKKDLTDVREKYKKTFEDEHVHIKDVDWSKLDNKKQESIAGITMFIRALGRDVVIEGSIDYKNGDVIYRNAANAYFDPADNSYHFNVSMMDNAYFNVAIHESIHDLAKNNYAAYKQIRDKLIELCDNDTSGMMDDFAHELNRLMKADTKGDVLDVAYEEWVANTVSGILADPNTFNQFANRFMDEETRRTFLQLIDAIMDYIREAFDKIKTALGWRQTQALENDLNALQDIREMLFQGYETIKNRLSYADKNASYDNLFQAHETNLTETELARYNEYATNALKGPGNNSERFVPVGEVSILIKEGLRKFGIELSDNSIHEIYDNNFRHLRKSHGIETEGQYGVTNGDIYAIPYIIAHPDGVYYCETTSGKKGILYVLNDVDSTYYVESVAVDGNLSGVQMMKSPLGVIPNQYKDTIVKEKALIALPNVQDHVGSSPQLYVQDVGRDHASNNNIDAQSKDVKSSVNTDVLENRAAEEFGTTYDWNETGYILTDGRRLDLSEKNNGGPRGHRSADHRIVGTLYEDLQGTAALVDFMNRGNIRIIPETGGIDISVAPNKKQLDVLDSYISKNRGEVIVDISDEQGNNLYSWEYAKGTYSKKIINDITNFFKDGTQPKISDIARFRYSSNADVLDQQYEQAVSSGDMEAAQRMVDEAAERAGYIPSNMFHGSMNATFHVFDKSKANPEGNSGAGFYFTTNREDAEQNYADVEGADNFFKTSALADKIFEDGEWNGIEVEDYDHAKQLAKDLLNKEPGMYEVYLKYDNPYYRDYRNSTDILAKIMDDFDESLVDRDDYDTDEDYEEDLMYARDEHIGEAVDRAVYRAYSDIEDQYEVIDGPFAQDVVSAIMEEIYNDDSLTWNDIKKAIEGLNTELTVTRADSIDTELASAEFTRAIIENFGYDAIYDKEVSTKFNQLNSNGREADHIIVFHPNQIKLSDPVTYDDQGNVIPLSKRFNTNKDDIRFSANIDSEGNKLSEEQQRYFEDSKVRDDEGNLLVMYHGTDAYENFTVFKKGKSGYLGPGIYLSSSKAYADRYASKNGYDGRVYTSYVNITNPLIVTSDNPAIEILGERVARRREEKNSYATTWITNSDIKKLQAKGYDGIIWKYGNTVEVSAWEPNQIKNTDNKNPTENLDIRYSSNTEELDREYEQTVESGNMDKAQRMVDTAAKQAGYDYKGYHGTAAQFNVFDRSRAGQNWYGDSQLGPGFYFAYDKPTAQRWTEGDRVVSAYLKMEHPLDYTKPIPADIEKVIRDNAQDKINGYDTMDNWTNISREQYTENVLRMMEIYLREPDLFIDKYKYDENGKMTDGIREFLESLGYDGIIDKKQMVVFYPEQIKSADPVTYDNNGNVIPLSQRFNDSNPDIRYSSNEDGVEPIDLSDDTELHKRIEGLKGGEKYNEIRKYIIDSLVGQQIELSDGTIAIIDNHDAKHLAHNSRPVKTASIGKLQEVIRSAQLYAYEDNVEHNKFDAFKYYKANVRYGEEVIPVYLNVGKAINDGIYHLYDITDKLRDTVNPISDLDRARGLLPTNGISNENIQDTRQSVNMDSLNNSDENNVENLKKTIGDQYRLTVGKEMTMPAAEKIARDVARRVSSKADKAELATQLKKLFDDAARQGKDLDTDAFMEQGAKIMRGVLEQSATFDSIRYKADEPLRKYLRETGIALNELQQGEAKYLFDSVANYRRALFGSVLIKNSGIPLDVAWQELNKMSSYLFPSDINDGDMVSYLYDAAKALSKANYYVNEYGFDLDGAAAYEFAQVVGDYTDNKRIKTFVQQLRTYGKRYLDNEMKEIRKTRREKMSIQSRLYEEQRKRNVSLKNEIANLNRELSGEVQNIERDITFLQSRLKYAEPGIDELSIREQIADLEQDKANLEARYREEIRNKTAQLQEGQEELEKIGKEYIKAGSTNTSLALDARKAAIGTKSAVKLRAQKEAQEKRTLQNNIRKKSSNLMSRLISGTDTKHVPENLREAVTGFLQAVDLGWNQGTLAAEKWLSDLNVLADKMAAANEVNGNFQVDSMIIDQLREMGARITERLSLAGKNLRTMSIAELNQLDDALSLVNAAIYNSDRLLADDRKQRASAVAERSITEMGKKKQRKHTNDLLGRVGNFFTLDQLDSFSYAERIGGPFKDVIFKNLRKAFDRKVQLVQQGIDAYHKAAAVFGNTEKSILSKIRSMSGNNAQTKTFDLENGKKLTLNTAQIMELYLLNERDQARIHLYNGGITVEEYKAKDGTVKKQEFIKVTEDDIDRIIGTLTKEQKQFANELQKYASSNMSEWGNDVSLTLWGVKKFAEQNYWPITVDDNTTDAVSQDKKNGNVGLYHLKNIGMSKAVNPKANNALVIGDVIDTYIRHVDEMTSYAAYTIPLDDAMKWYNYKNGNQTVQRSIESLMGKGGKAWFTDFIRALNNAQDMSGGMDFADTMIRNAKVAAIAANLRVVIQQPSAFARAIEAIDPKYLLNVSNLNVKQGAKEAQEHSSIARWKNWGFRDVNVGGDLRSLMVGDNAILEQVREKASLLAGVADDATWGALWNACKAEIEDKRKDLEKGSEEYWQAISDRFAEVIDRTQVVDSPFHRSKAMRSKNALWKMYTAFMSEPTKTYNMFYKTISNAYQGNWSAETRKAVARATFAFAAATILNSVLAAIVDVGRDTDDEDWWEKYLKNMGQNMLDGFNPLNLIPIGKDIVSIFDGYEASRMDLDAVSDLIKQLKRAGSTLSGEKDYNVLKIVYDSVMALSKITGIPAGNAWRGINSLLNLTGVDVSVFKGTWNNTNAKAVAEDMYSYFAKGDMAGFQRVFDKYVEDEVSKMVEEDTKTLEETGQHKYDSTESMQNKATKAVLNKLAQQLADNEEQIAEAYLAKTIGDGSEVARIRNEYMAKGIPEEVFDKAVNLYGSSMNVQPEGVNELNSKLYSYDDLYAAIESGDLEDIGYIYDEMIEDSQSMNPEEYISNKAVKEFRDKYYEYVGSGQTAKASQLENTLEQAFGLTSEDLASYKTGYQKYAFVQKAGPDSDDITTAAITTYNTVLKGLGITESTWYDVWKFKNTTHADVDKNGKSIDGSLRDKIFRYIDSLPLSPAQKSALAKECGYGESSIQKNKLW